MPNCPPSPAWSFPCSLSIPLFCLFSSPSRLFGRRLSVLLLLAGSTQHGSLSLQVAHSPDGQNLTAAARLLGANASGPWADLTARRKLEDTAKTKPPTWRIQIEIHGQSISSGFPRTGRSLISPRECGRPGSRQHKAASTCQADTQRPRTHHALPVGRFSQSRMT